MDKILPLFAKKTGGESYTSHKYCYDAADEVPGVSYDDDQDIEVKTYGESDRGLTKPKDLTEKARQVNRENNPLFRYFLDGSRRTYKVDDVAYDKRVYPIVAGQLGVGCCERQSAGKFKIKILENDLMLAVPSIASKDSRNRELFFNQLKEEINEKVLAKRKQSLGKIHYYPNKTLQPGEKYEHLGIAKIQDEMVYAEKKIVAELATKNMLGPGAYLLKDGSLEYQKMATGELRDLSKIKSNYQCVVGVSKSFNPERIQDRRRRSIAKQIADLKLFHRTPAIMYESTRVRGVLFSSWYLRIREKRYTVSPFDGVIKVEKILVSPEEQKEGLQTQEVDLISANLICERNPVSYGKDKRWANHLYPIYLTETFIKSQYLSDTHMLHLF